jgi:LysM repeat protein
MSESSGVKVATIPAVIASLVLHAAVLGLLYLSGSDPKNPKESDAEKKESVQEVNAPIEEKAAANNLPESKKEKDRVHNASPAEAKVPEVSRPSADDGWETLDYTVKSGDNLTVLARKSGMTNAEFAEMNDTTAKKLSVLRIGQRLIIRRKKQ